MYNHDDNLEMLLSVINSDLWIECEQLSTGKHYYIRILESIGNVIRFNSISSNIVRHPYKFNLTPKAFSLIINSIHKDRLDNYEILQPVDCINTDDLIRILGIE